MRHHVTIKIEKPDGTTDTYSGPGDSIGAFTDAELLASAEKAALAEAPDGSTIAHSRLTR